jgi:hypothetical protein
VTEDEVEAQITLLQQQQALQTNAIRAALEARWSGEADSVDGFLKALDPNIETNPQTPLYPDVDV